MTRLILLLLASILLFAGPAAAQNYAIDGIGGGNLGSLVASSSGTTTFTVEASSGMVTKSGGGVRLSGAGDPRALITFSCGNQKACDSDQPIITVAASGSPTGRAGAITAFSVSTSGASASFASGSPPAAAQSLSFSLSSIGKNGSVTLYVGYALPIAGDGSGGATGNATSGFAITISRSNGNGTVVRGADVNASVLRTLTASTSRDLAFGRLVPPSSGTGTATLSPGGSMSVSGSGMAALSSFSTALVGVTGEGGQLISVSVPAIFSLISGSESLDVTTLPSESGSLVLSGSSGSAGTANVEIGGQISVPSDAQAGAYSGSFSVIFQYN